MNRDVLKHPAIWEAAARLLSAEAATDLLRRSGLEVQWVEPLYVRLKPPTGVLVGYRAGGRDDAGKPLELTGYVRNLSGARARTLAAKWNRMRPTETPLGPGVRLLDDGHSVLFLFPNDARLRGLRFVADMQKLKRILGELRELSTGGFRVRGRRSAIAPVRYKPERRLVASADLRIAHGEETARRRVFLRFFPDARGAGVAEVAEALRYGGGASLLPRPLGAVFDGRLFVEEWVPGPEVLDPVLDGTADGAELASALQRLHGTETPWILPERRPAALLSHLSQGLGVLATVEPSLRPAATALLEDLRGMVPDPVTATIHGDLHLHQVVLGDQGPVFVDLERAAAGHPLQDVGELVAHLLELAEDRPDVRSRILAFRDAFLDGWLLGRPLEDLPFFIGVALANRALLPFRRVEEGWRQLSQARMALARSVLRT
jgi:Phosphotransferase enzyme family